MKTPQSKSTKLDEELDDLLFDCIVAIGVRDGGTVTDLDTLIIDRQKAVNALAQYIESKVLEGRRSEIKNSKKLVKKLRDIYLLKSDFEFPEILDDPMQDKVVRNWDALRAMILKDLDERLAELEATPKGRSEK